MTMSGTREDLSTTIVSLPGQKAAAKLVGYVGDAASELKQILDAGDEQWERVGLSPLFHVEHALYSGFVQSGRGNAVQGIGRDCDDASPGKYGGGLVDGPGRDGMVVVWPQANPSLRVS